MRRLPQCIATFCLILSLTAPASSGARFAEAPTVHLLAVGVDNYADPRIARLRTPAHDADRLAAVLASMGARVDLGLVTVLKDQQATRVNIISAYRSMLSQVKPDDVIIFFWSGHSVRLGDTPVSLLTYDFRLPDQRVEALPEALDLQRDILKTTPATQTLLIIGDGCNIGDGSLGVLLDLHPNVAILTSSKSDEKAIEPATRESTAFVQSLIDVLKNENADLDGDGELSVEELYIQLYLKMLNSKEDYHVQHPNLAGLRSHRISLATAKGIDREPAPAMLQVSIAGMPLASKEIFVNGQHLDPTDYRLTNGKVTFLSSGAGLISGGMNLLQVGRDKYHLWRLGGTLKAFREPYHHSRAIIAAIDDYDRDKDPAKRGATGYPQLSGMVDRAKELKRTLLTLGFSEADIIELYNGDATSERFEHELKKFWVGGANAETDRLFVYFGGHGDEFQKTNLLITYDYDPKHRLLTSFQTKDLIERHSRSIQAKHVLFAIDVCYSGLVFLGPDDREGEQKEVEENARLAVIERNMTSTARNIIVAGTGDQRALWENGGIFTAALIEGLRGKGDPANTGVIQFDQLGIFVKDRVTSRARLAGFKQVPRFATLDDFGDGRVMFMRPKIGGN